MNKIEEQQEMKVVDSLICSINDEWKKDGIRVQVDKMVGKRTYPLYTITLFNDTKIACTVVKTNLKLREVTPELCAIRNIQRLLTEK